jgi:hypothetical protein
MADRLDITEILLKVALNTIKPNKTFGYDSAGNSLHYK